MTAAYRRRPRLYAYFALCALAGTFYFIAGAYVAELAWSFSLLVSALVVGAFDGLLFGTLFFFAASAVVSWLERDDDQWKKGHPRWNLCTYAIESPRAPQLTPYIDKKVKVYLWNATNLSGFLLPPNGIAYPILQENGNVVVVELQSIGLLEVYD